MKKNTNDEVINFGLIKNTILSEVNDKKRKKMLREFLVLVKREPILKTQFKIYTNLSNKRNLANESAIRYIDNNIILIKGYTKKELREANECLRKFMVDGVKPSVVDMAIHQMIIESVKDVPNVDKLHDSFEVILESVSRKTIKDEAEVLYEEITNEADFDIFFENYVLKYKEAYADLDEFDKKIVNAVSYDNDIEKVYIELKEHLVGVLRKMISVSRDSEEKVKIYETLDLINTNNGFDTDRLLSMNDLRKKITNN